MTINDTEHEREYTLEFNRDSVKFAERRGFKLEDLENYPMTKIPEFFWYAFRMHHPSVSATDAERMLDELGGMNEALATRLGELWAATFNSLSEMQNGVAKNSKLTMEL